MTFQLDAVSERNLAGVHPDLVAVMRRAARLSAVPFRVIEGLRDARRQAALKAKGASQVKVSRHQSGHAVDVAALVNGKIDWDFPLYSRINEAVQIAAREQATPIIWGGVWKSLRDGGHFELPKAQYPAGKPHAGKVDIKVNPPAAAKTMALRPGSKGYRVKALQERLAELGYFAGAIDSDFGPLTRNAVMAFQADAGLASDGVAGERTLAALDSAKPKLVSVARGNASMADLRATGTRTVKAADIASVSAPVAAAAGVAQGIDDPLARAGEIADKATSIKGLTEMALEVWQWGLDHLGIVIVVAASFAVWRAAGAIKKARLADHRSGANVGR
jgi:peptidoglycan L-alanyl-D-glutamate endopeptidase CwlK